MTSSEFELFAGIVESKLEEEGFCFSDTMSFSVDKALETSAAGAEESRKIKHRLMRIVSSLESQTPDRFFPVRCLPWYALFTLRTWTKGLRSLLQCWDYIGRLHIIGADVHR